MSPAEPTAVDTSESSGFAFDRGAYLKRIDCTERPAETLAFLTALHWAQLSTIPFENFDLCLNRSIALEPELLFDKLVRHRRGGYCFEVNGLFLMALRDLGFSARALLGRVHVTGRPGGRSHQVSLVTLDGQEYLLDVGFGSGTPPVPVPVELDRPVATRRGTYRLVGSETFGTMLQLEEDGSWSDLYSFDREHVCAGDIEFANHYTSTSPRSHFVTSRIAALPTDEGIVTLHERTFKRRVGAVVVEERELEEGQPYLDLLRGQFGIELDARYEDLRPLAGPGRSNGG